VFIAYSNVTSEVATLEERTEELERWRSETSGNRFTSGQASDMQITFMREMQGIRSDMNQEINSLKECINRVIIDGNRARC